MDELMRRDTMQVMGAIHDILGHNAPETREFNQLMREKGLKAAIAERDGRFS